MDYEALVTAVLTVLGAALVLSQLTEDPKDNMFVKTITDLVKFMWHK